MYETGKMKLSTIKLVALLVVLTVQPHYSEEQTLYFPQQSPLLVNHPTFTTYAVVDSLFNASVQCSIGTPCSCISCDSSTPIYGTWNFLDFNSTCYFQETQSNTVYVQLSLVRLVPTLSINESFTLSCCTCQEETKVSSASLTVIVSISAYITQRVVANASTGTYAEPTLYQAGFVDWGACSCDLTPNYCDINCCCDPNCTTATISQQFSGCAASYVQILDRSCAARPYTRSDYSKLMCVLYENNAIAAYIYPNITIINSWSDYSTLYSQGTSTPYLFKKLLSPRVDEYEENPPTAYVQNLAVKAVMTDVTTDSSAPLLSVAQTTLTWSACTSNVPVQVLKPFSSVCVQRATANTCADQYGPFSYLTYLQPPASALYSVSAMNTVSALGISAVTYYRANDSQVADFLVSNTLGNTSCWSYATSMNEVSLPETIGQSPTPCAPPNFDRTQAGEIIWSNFNPTDDLTLDYIDDFCVNAVLAIEYDFAWTRQNLSAIQAKILLGNVPMDNLLYAQGALLNSANLQPADNIVVNQHLKVNFTHLSAAPASTDFTFPWDPDAYTVTQYSGSIGYQLALPVIFSVLPSDYSENINWTQINSTVQNSGCSAIQQTYQTQIALLPSYQRSFHIIRPAGIGMCSDAQQQTIMFLQNMTGSCKMRIRLTDIMASNNCMTFNRTVVSYLNEYLPFNFDFVTSWVSVNGKPTLNVTQAATNNGNDILNQWMPISWGTTYYRFLPINGSDVENPATVVYDEQTKGYSLIRGICQGVVTGAKLNIYYQSAGKQKSHQLYQIVGAALQYTFDDVAAYCVGPQSSQVCRPGSAMAVQDFMVTTSVQWISVAASDSGPAYIVCWHDWCAEEIFWIFNPAFYSGEPFSSVLLYGLTILFGAIAVFFVTRPWH